MKVKFKVRLFDKVHEEIIEIDEEKIKASGYSPKNKLNVILNSWVDMKINSEFQIIEDSRFDLNECNNMPYVDEVTKRKLGWNNVAKF